MTGSVRDEQVITAAEEGRAPEKKRIDTTGGESLGEAVAGDCGDPRGCFRWGLDLMGEALGLCFIKTAIGSVISANVFLSTGLLYLARAEAGCLNPGPCDGEVHGMHPDSLLTNIAWIGGLITACFLPIIGSIVDHTPYRRQVGIFSSVCLVALNGTQISISENTWWAMALIQVVAVFAFVLLRVTSLSYVPELSENVNEQNEYNSIFEGFKYTSMLLCMIITVVLSKIPGVDTVGTARIGQVLLVTVSTLSLGYAWWHLMKNRPPVDKVPEGSSLMRAGFVKIYRTSVMVCTKYRAIMWFFVSAMFMGAGQSGWASTVITVAMSLLGMDGTMVGVFTITVVLFGIPGAFLSQFVTKRLDPLRSLMASALLMTATTAIAAAVLTSPDQKMLSFLFGALWGCGMGWSGAAEQTFFAMAIPSGAPSELYGTWYFFSATLSWVPPLLFSLLNERGVSMQWGLVSIAFFFLLALLFLFPIGGYQKALDQVTDGEDDSIPVASVGGSCHSSAKRHSSVALFPTAEIEKV